MKLRTATLAAAILAATIPNLPTSAHAFGFRGGWGWGWGGVGVGLATGALVGTALAAPYYGPYGYDVGYPVYGPAYGAYGYDYGYAPAYAYDDDVYGYAPSYGYASYAYDVPSYGYAYATPSWGYGRQYAYRHDGYRHYAAYPAVRSSVRAAYALYRPGLVRAAHGGSVYRAHARH